MKLLLCMRCGDVRKLQRRLTVCDCGYVSGRYLADGVHAEVSAHAQVLGLDNADLVPALKAAEVGGDERTRRISSWAFSRIIPSRITWLPE